MKTLKNTVRMWLIENNYEDIAQLIDDIMLEWQKTGNKQRRNWWDVLAGDKNGQQRIIAGHEIPVLRAAQIRKGIKITKNSLCRSNNEKSPLGVKENNRWKSINK